MSLPKAPSLQHVEHLCAEHGIIQFSKPSGEPDVDSGFCLDDNVRLLVLAVSILREDPLHSFATNAGNRVFDFIAEASREAPVYHNMMDRDGNFYDRFASPESIGRLIRALGIVLRDSPDPSWRARAMVEMQRAMVALPALSSEHARAFAALGFAAAVEAGQTQYADSLRALAEAMHFEFERNSSSDWRWPLPAMDYDNGRLPEALLRAGQVLGEAALLSSGEKMLDFLAGVVQPREMFEPIGAPGWYARGGERPYYAQQPLEALAMMDAWLADGDVTRARVAYEWFLGHNRDELIVADLARGGCRDGIDAPGRLNACMGAESTLAYVQAAWRMREIDRQSLSVSA
ncbi:MAG TPA: hypothetical protein VMF11_01360 [Candidatus Baltobacteraceae bacterium]|nr:hypothetical protein [Candidatus Baltobacteraceae bacterium]